MPLTQALIEAPSPNPPGDERAAGRVVGDYLAGLAGVDSRTIEPSPRRQTLVFAVGEGPPTVAFSAHLDTHPVDGAWTRDPYNATVEGDHLYGLGATDIKGGVAAMAVVFRAFAERSRRPHGRLLLIANADEETGGEHGVTAVRDGLGEPIDAVVIAEPSGIDEPFEHLYVAARGTSRFRLSVTGVETHSSLADHGDVANAIERAERALVALRAELEPFLAVEAYGRASRLVPVRVAGGVGWGVVPKVADVDVELRVVPGSTQEDIESRVGAALESAAASLGAPIELTFADGSLRWMSPSASAPDEPIVVAATAAWADVFGQGPQLGCFPGGTDARLYSERGIPTLAGVGPGALRRAHRPDEYVKLGELEQATWLYATIIDRYLSGATQ